MSNPIIVGVDGSKTAAKAAEKAAGLAKVTGAPLHIICAFAKEKAVAVNEGTDSWLLTASSEAETIADGVAALHRADGLKVTTAAIQGKPDEALVAEAERLGAALIVVGNKRVQGLARVLGSVAMGVAQQAPCDVYVAHTTG